MEASENLYPVVASLRKSLATMEDAISALPVPVAVLDASKDLAWVNTAFEQLVGCSRLFLIGSPFVSVIRSLIAESVAAERFSARFLGSNEGTVNAVLSLADQPGGPIGLTKTFRLKWSPGADTESCVVIFRDIDADLEVIRLEQKSHSLEQETLTCQLTGLLNRDGFLRRFDAIEPFKKQSYAILFLDLDGFKFVNDSYGHDLGDEILRVVGSRIQSTIQSNDFAARLSGDEFALAINLLQEGSIDEVKKIGLSLAQVVGRPVETYSKAGVYIRIQVEVSVGITLVENGDQISDVLSRADGAMYCAKKSQSGHVSIRLKNDAELLDRSRVVTSQVLALIVESGNIPLHLQPIYDVNKGVVIGYEALMRPVDASGELVPIASLLRVASDSARLSDLERVVFSSAARLSCLGCFSDSSVTLAVNVSVLSLSRSDFVDEILAEFREVGFPLNRLIVEVTESDLIQNIVQVRESLIRLRSAGSKVYLDDFCTGHTGFAQLIELPVDGFKVDQAFVYKLLSSKEAVAVMHSLVLLGQSLDLDVVVEGVESGKQLDLVRSMGMSLCQGFFLGIPQDPRAFDPAGVVPVPVQACSLELRRSGAIPFAAVEVEEEVF
ncbi:MAG: EAL domain-containing protein [Synechococcus sp. WH 8007]|nr:EAL domain-containing protein [Synechococcus sp. WH 8007]